ncbi:hypothetical protein OCQ_27750, partial [Mycobacterium rhizamassiliense]
VARSFEPPATKGRASPVTLIVGAAAFGLLVLTPPPRAHAAPAPEVEYVYDVVVRRHYGFPNNDALTYGHGICDKVGRGEAYGQVMGDVKSDVTPSDEFAANYLVSYAVNLLCPALIWQLRNSAAGYLPPGGAVAPGTYYSDAGGPKARRLRRRPTGKGG